MKRSFSFVLILFTLALFFNNVVNRHFHRLPNGLIVEHAHPFQTGSDKEPPFEKHKHSDIEYLLLDLVYVSGLIVLLAFSGLILFLQSGTSIEVCRPVPVVMLSKSKTPRLRGPPLS